jgi:hypothetical protein
MLRSDGSCRCLTGVVPESRPLPRFMNIHLAACDQFCNTSIASCLFISTRSRPNFREDSVSVLTRAGVPCAVSGCGRGEVPLGGGGNDHEGEAYVNLKLQS